MITRLKNIDEYQEMVYNLAREYSGFGAGNIGAAKQIMPKLLEEVHEVDTALFPDNMAEELGDCLFCVVQMASELGYDMSVILAENIEKLKNRRYEDNLNNFLKPPFFRNRI